MIEGLNGKYDLLARDCICREYLVNGEFSIVFQAISGGRKLAE
jgi:hypothetical protein